MLTVLFASLSSFIGEISSSIIKFETDRGKESVYTAGFINMLFGLAAFILLASFSGRFIFSAASLFTFVPKAILEIVQAQVSMLALMKSDRSTFAFLRNLTIPLLLAADLIFGFSVSAYQWAGIGMILAIFLIIIWFHVLNFRGAVYPIFTAVNAVATISLFKYNITHFNSVEGEQIATILILMVYFFLAAKIFSRENPFLFLKNKIFLGQGIFHGAASILGSFAISFGNPGIAMAAERASAVLAGIISGHNYFQEKKFGAKLLVSLGLVVGLTLLTR